MNTVGLLVNKLVEDYDGTPILGYIGRYLHTYPTYLVPEDRRLVAITAAHIIKLNTEGELYAFRRSI